MTTKLKISCNDRKRRILLRFLGLSFPAWGLISTVYCSSYYLHEQSPPMVHRDFTPDNLIVDANGQLKLIDFNVAHQISNDSKATVVGKHAYMPPEQFAGRPRTQSDLYALGATIYFALCGYDPEPFSQSGLPPDCVEVHPVWGEIIAGCTALDLSSRFKSAAEVMALLHQMEATQDNSELEGIKINIADELSEDKLDTRLPEATI